VRGGSLHLSALAWHSLPPEGFGRIDKGGLCGAATDATLAPSVHHAAV